MATIFYGIAGEGRGHATRARAVIEALRGDHRIILYTCGQALSMLGSLYRDTEVKVRAIPGLMWRYDAAGHPDYGWTFAYALPYLAMLPLAIRRLREDFERDQPCLIISDFEPLVARAAAAAGIPFVSLDHQHFLTTYDLRELPMRLLCHAQLMGAAVKLFHSGATETIVSSFFRPPLLPGLERTSQVGPLLRPEVLNATTRDGTHLCAYIRRDAPAGFLQALSRCNHEVRLYGLGARPAQGRLRFFDVHPTRFVEDLAQSRGLVSTAGNQLIGEALYLGKPVFAMPEPGNFEQEINAHFIARGGVGVVADMTRVTSLDLARFADRVDDFKANIDRETANGNPEALARLAHHLSLGAPQADFNAAVRQAA